MKNGITFISTLILMCTILWSCSTEQSQVTAQAAPEEKEAVSKRLSDLRTGEYIHRLDSTKAQTYIDNFEVFNDSIINSSYKTYPNAKQQLVRGSKVDLIELREILLYAEEGDELFAMNAMMPDNTSEIIFQLNSKKDNRWYYFDFTRPCPNACPDMDKDKDKD